MSSIRSIFCGGLTILTAAATQAQDVASQVRSLTGARTRLVWSQDQANSDFRGYDDNDKLYGFDTDDGNGVRQICANGDCGTSGYTKPLFTNDGARVVYSNRVDNYVYVVDFDGSNRRQITKGLATSVRSIGGTHWVYLRKGDNGDGDEGGDIRRYNLDNTAESQVVWTKSDVGNNHQIWFSVSGDGSRAAGTFPWSSARSVTLPNGSYLGSGNGCWTSMAPDNSYRWWVFEGSHQKVSMYNGSDTKIASVTVNNTPATSGKEVYYPRWSNHPRYMTMCGPGVGGANSDVYIGAIAADFKSTSGWVRVTNNSKGDYYADSWVSFSGSSRAATPAISPSQSSFSGSVAVTMTCATSGATIRYTTNNTDPTASSQAYTGPVTLTATTTVKARAFADGMDPSAVASRTYTLVAPPVITTVAVTPASATVSPGASFTFSATALDQYGDALASQPATTWSVSGGGSIDAAGVFTAGKSVGGPHTVTATMTSGGVTVSGSAQVTVADVHIRMNAGDNTVAGWESQDTYATAGTDFSTSAAIDISLADTPGPMALYQTCHRAEPSFVFAGLSNGDYLVRLHFAEPNDIPEGRRQMTILIEGTPVETGFDIVAVAGAPRTAVVREYVVTVADGNGMSIALENGTGNDAFLNGIEIVATTEKPVPIVVLSPTGGESYRPGDTLRIRWQTNDPMITGVVPQLTPDEGETWLTLVPSGSIDDDDPEWGDFVWVVPDDALLYSSACRVRIHEYNRADVFGESPQPFTIGASAVASHPRSPSAPAAPITVTRLHDGVLRISLSERSSRMSLHRIDGRLVPTAPAAQDNAVLLKPSGLGTLVLRVQTPNGILTRQLTLTH